MLAPLAAVILALLLPSGSFARAPVLHLSSFSSPDHKVTCEFFAGAVICGSSDDGSQTSAEDGSHNGVVAAEEVVICNRPPGRGYCNSDTHTQFRARALPAGRVVEAEGFRCVSERGGIACIETAGRLAGRGFWIDARRARRIRRPVPSMSPPGVASQPELWSALGGSVRCGIEVHESAPARAILCNASSIPAPVGVDPSLGEPGWAYLEATGRPGTILNSQIPWQAGLNEKKLRIPKLATGTTWSFKPLGVSCSVGETAVSCTNRSGHGFTLSAEIYTEF